MHITLTNTGKRFNRDWIFRHLTCSFLPQKKYAITGPNGSGKSTLLQVISGSITYNEGQMEFYDEQLIEPEQHFRHISMAAPYLELVEEMTASEFLSFHTSFKPFSISCSQALQVTGLEKAAQKEIRYFSSGMKQRLKLAQAFFCASPVLLLDEPTTNLDAEGIALYHFLIENYTAKKLVVISSNDKQEYSFCDEVIEITRFK